MEQTLRQVGELLLGAVPTTVLLLTLYVLYHFLVHKPLQRVLTERRARTEGAQEKARADVAAAEAKAAEYEEKLREAKVAIFKAQETKRQQAQQARAAVLSQARGKADAQVKEARAAIEKDVAESKQSLQGEIERLANDIIRTVLGPAGAGQAPVAGGQS